MIRLAILAALVGTDIGFVAGRVAQTLDDAHGRALRLRACQNGVT